MHQVQSKYFQQAEVQKRNQPENIFKLTIQYLRLPALVRVGAEIVHQGKSRKEAIVNVRKA